MNPDDLPPKDKRLFQACEFSQDFAVLDAVLAELEEIPAKERRRALELVQWEVWKNSDDVAQLQGVLLSCKIKSVRRRIQSRIDSIAAEQREQLDQKRFAEAEQEDTLTAYYKYIGFSENETRKQAALDRITQLQKQQAELAWQSAKDADIIEAYEKYLDLATDNDPADHRKEAQVRLGTLKKSELAHLWTEAQEKEDVTAYAELIGKLTLWEEPLGDSFQRWLYLLKQLGIEFEGDFWEEAVADYNNWRHCLKSPSLIHYRRYVNYGDVQRFRLQAEAEIARFESDLKLLAEMGVDCSKEEIKSVGANAHEKLEAYLTQSVERLWEKDLTTKINREADEESKYRRQCQSEDEALWLKATESESILGYLDYLCQSPMFDVRKRALPKLAELVPKVALTAGTNFAFTIGAASYDFRWIPKPNDDAPWSDKVTSGFWMLSKPLDADQMRLGSKQIFLSPETHRSSYSEQKKADFCEGWNRLFRDLLACVVKADIQFEPTIPGEDQWEYAMSAGKKERFWRDDYDSAYWKPPTTPEMNIPSNEWGLFPKFTYRDGHCSTYYIPKPELVVANHYHLQISQLEVLREFKQSVFLKKSVSDEQYDWLISKRASRWQKDRELGLCLYAWEFLAEAASEGCEYRPMITIIRSEE